MFTRQFGAFAALPVIFLLTMTAGCGKTSETTEVVEKTPRPVLVAALESVAPPTSSLVTASVGAWKTEDIGFEVSGRVEWVAEPNTNIEGRVSDASGNLIMAGTPISRIENERYQLQVGSAKSRVEQAKQNLNAAQIELTKSIPAQIRAAQAEKELAVTEFQRSQRLYQQNAGAKSDVDRDKANHENAVSKLEQLQASEKAKVAEVESLKSNLLQSKQSLRDAERNLEDCTLFSSFRGQVASTSVVPGSVVSAGQAVAKVQMMDPIKLEVEVSAEESRRLKPNGRLPVLVDMPDGSVQEKDGFLYLVDPVADPQTRTYTVTLLVMNEKKHDFPEMENIALSEDIWRTDFEFLPGAKEGMLFVGEKGIRKDADGFFLWKVENANVHKALPENGLLKVSKTRIKPGELKIPFLGNWIFQQIEILDDNFDSESALVVGALVIPDGSDPDEWNGDTIYMDGGGQWMLRPGDLAKVNLSGDDIENGIYVPMDAIMHERSKSFLFVVENETERQGVVKQVEIKVVDHESSHSSPSETSSSMRRIESANGVSLVGKRFVIKGSHYLRDGEKVAVVESAKAK